MCKDIEDEKKYGVVDFRRLIKRIIALSKSKVWDEAKKEWKYCYSSFANNYCLCGHKIYENCHIENTQTRNLAIIGNVCIRGFDESFFSIHTELLKFISNKKKRLAPNVIRHFMRTREIEPKSGGVYIKMGKRRKLTPYERAIKSEVEYTIKKAIIIKASKGEEHD